MIENKPLHVVAAVIVRGNEVLACRRAPHKVSAGLWEFPGGKVEPGETPHEALAREINEELALECAPERTFDVSDTQMDGVVIRLETVLCRISETRILASTDHDKFAWLDVDSISGLSWAKPDLPAVRALASFGPFEGLLT